MESPRSIELFLSFAELARQQLELNSQLGHATVFARGHRGTSGMEGRFKRVGGSPTCLLLLSCSEILLSWANLTPSYPQSLHLCR